MFNLAGLLAVALAAPRFDARSLKRIGLVALALVIVIPVAYGITVAVPVRTKPALRVQWPGAEIAERMAGIWDRSTQGAPLKIVAGENWIAGLVGLRHKDRPHLLSNANLHHSPWITPRQLEAEGMLVLWDDEKAPDRPACLHQRAHAAVAAGDLQIAAFTAGHQDPLHCRAAKTAPR